MINLSYWELILGFDFTLTECQMPDDQVESEFGKDLIVAQNIKLSLCVSRTSPPTPSIYYSKVPFIF